MIFCKNISRLFCALIVAMAACMLSGCYSFTAAVVDMFKRNAGGVRLVNDNANADFEITLLSYSNKPENYNSNSDVETYRVTIRVEVKFYDNVKERIIYESKSLSADGVYDVQANETEDRHGQTRAVTRQYRRNTHLAESGVGLEYYKYA